MSGEKISAGVGGRVTEVNFREGDRVKEGDVLLRMDTRRIDNEIARMERQGQGTREEVEKLQRMLAALEQEREASVAKAHAELAEAEEGVRNERARIRVEEERQRAEERLAHTDLENRRAERRRKEREIEAGVTPRVELVRAEEALKEAEGRFARARVKPSDAALALAEGRVNTARQQINLLERQYSLKGEEIQARRVVREGELEASRKGLANLNLERDQTVIRAHTTGIVTVGEVRVGDLIEQGKPVVAIAQEKGFRADASVKSENVGLLRVGMKARIKLDAYDYQKYGTLEGTVYYISPDSEMTEASGGPKTAQYIVRIRLEQLEIVKGHLKGKVKLGMQGQAEILTGEDFLLSLAFRKFRDKLAVR